jgi:acetolactate synthase I/II/III large subunit
MKGRRKFLKTAALVSTVGTSARLNAAALPASPSKKKADQPVTAAQANAESGDLPPEARQLVEAKSGSDFMVDVFKSLSFDYAAAMPGSSFRGLQESFVNYGKNESPEWITCLHEEISVGIAHGYAKVEGKPLLSLVHSTVGTQHASMAIYNAFADRVPVFVVTANFADAILRRPGVEATHTVQDGAALVRDFTKWDDSPGGLQHFAESTVRAQQIALAPPMGPVVLVCDARLQEDPLPDQSSLNIPRLPRFTAPQGQQNAIDELAQLLVAAQNPILIADRGVPGPTGVLSPLLELAQLLQCAVVDTGARMNFPTRHPLNQSNRRGAALQQADLLVGLDMTDFWGTIHSYTDQLHRSYRSLLSPEAKTVSISVADQPLRSNYQNFQRFTDVDMEIVGDGAATLPALIKAVKPLLSEARRAAFAERGQRLAAASAAAFDLAREEAASGWDESPITTARLAMEVWEVIKGEDFSLVSANATTRNWARRLWTMDKSYHFLGDSGAYGIGYGAPGTVGAALANRKYGRFSVAIIGDGDLMVAPGALWTAAKHQIPVLMVVHNNRSYFQELMHLQRMAARRSRNLRTANIGTEISDPNIDFAKLANSMDVAAEGPISDPRKLAPALRRVAAIVKKGKPALLDVISQGR